MKRRAIVVASPELIAATLGLREDVHIIGIRIDPFASGRVDLLIEGAEIPEVPEGQVPAVMPSGDLRVYRARDPRLERRELL